MNLKPENVLKIFHTTKVRETGNMYFKLPVSSKNLKMAYTIMQNAHDANIPINVYIDAQFEQLHYMKPEKIQLSHAASKAAIDRAEKYYKALKDETRYNNEVVITKTEILKYWEQIIEEIYERTGIKRRIIEASLRTEGFLRV